MLVAGAQQQAFGAAKEEALTGHCRRCLHLELCWGDCPKHPFCRAPDGEPGLNSHLCAGLKRFMASPLPIAPNWNAASRAADRKGAAQEKMPCRNQPPGGRGSR